MAQDLFAPWKRHKGREDPEQGFLKLSTLAGYKQVA